MSSVITAPELLIENVNVVFSSGMYQLSAKSGYTLVSAYIVNRPSEERNIYAVISMQCNTDGTYNLRNQNDSLSASTRLRLVWAKN